MAPAEEQMLELEEVDIITPMEEENEIVEAVDEMVEEPVMAPMMEEDELEEAERVAAPDVEDELVEVVNAGFASRLTPEASGKILNVILHVSNWDSTCAKTCGFNSACPCITAAWWA